MARLDPSDDSVNRLVVFHFRYDPDRKERRNVEVAAFDSEPEFLAEIERLSNELRSLKEAGLAEAKEFIGGAVKEAGYAEEHRRRRSRARDAGA